MLTSTCKEYTVLIRIASGVITFMKKINIELHAKPCHYRSFRPECRGIDAAWIYLRSMNTWVLLGYNHWIYLFHGVWIFRLLHNLWSVNLQKRGIVWGSQSLFLLLGQIAVRFLLLSQVAVCFLLLSQVAECFLLSNFCSRPTSTFTSGSPAIQSFINNIISDLKIKNTIFFKLWRRQQFNSTIIVSTK